MTNDRGKEWGDCDVLPVWSWLTPHPGPLPIEGRGGAKYGFDPGVAFRRIRCVLVVRADPVGNETNAATALRIQECAQRDSLSPQWGEGWGEG